MTNDQKLPPPSDQSNTFILNIGGNLIKQEIENNVKRSDVDPMEAINELEKAIKGGVFIKEEEKDAEPTD